MIINGKSLLDMTPIKDMVGDKMKQNGVSYGLGEAGYDIRIKQEIWLAPNNRFKLASAIEEFDMPTNLVGVVHDKSTWARRGLSVFNTVIEPGFKGGLTLELVYHGVEGIHIKAGSGIAQVLFHETAERAAYDGKYQHQSTDPVPARDS